MDNEESSNLFKVWTTLIQLLHDRQFTVPAECIINSLQEFRNKLKDSKSREPLEFLATKGQEVMLVKFPDEPSVKIPLVASIGEQMYKDGIQRCILISKGDLAPTARNAIAELTSVFRIEYFHQKELITNITEHQLVPRHKLLTDDEKDSLLERYKIKENKLPKIQISDPVARYLGLVRGNVVKIIRPSETAGLYITYRLAC